MGHDRVVGKVACCHALLVMYEGSQVDWHNRSLIVVVTLRTRGILAWDGSIASNLNVADCGKDVPDFVSVILKPLFDILPRSTRITRPERYLWIEF